MKKKFSETRLGKWIKEKAPSILEKVGDYFPPVGILSELIGKDRLNLQEKMEFERLSQEYEKEELRLHLADVQDARKSNVVIQ